MSKLFRFLRLFICLSIPILLTACSSVSPQTMVQERVFPKVSLEFLSEYDLPKTTYQDTLVGGLSAIAYDRRKNLFYVLSDDRSIFAPARFYTFSLQIEGDKIKNIKLVDVTLLKNPQGKTYLPDSIDPEGLSLSPRNTVFISSEGVPGKNIAPFVAEFNLESGEQQLNLRLPQRYLSDKSPENPEPTRGIRENLGFEALTINNVSSLPDDPFRIFTATESSLLQDSPSEIVSQEEIGNFLQPRIRMLHYVVNSVGSPGLLAEHLYLEDAAPGIVVKNGLTELLVFQEKYFLSLERTFGIFGFGAKIFQVVVNNATDTSRIESLAGDISRVVPMRKKLLLDLSQLNINLDNLEGMTVGPTLPDGSQTLLLVSDDNFREEQKTQFLLFRLVQG